MKPRTITLWVIGFVVLHFCVGFLCFYVDVFGTGTMVRVYEDYYGYPKNLFRVGHEVLWFPAGPFSSLVWAVPFYSIMSLVGWAINRRRGGNVYATTV
jgi:hypothetical protein